ncbi:unspecified product [Trypanosoma cruzi Dm28c]|uniref:Unspecified product n=1 Tax=Trypanosoma cruzi Dm28c TaxID=1416333 RepID=V5AJE2_TRYCR|nr:unspecified product [Trypanosoma cruzi Dm28c]
MDNSSAHQPLEYRSNVQRPALMPASQNIWEYSLMFGAERFLCSSAQFEFLHQRIGSAISHFTLMQPRSAGAASVSSVRQSAQPIGAIHSSFAWRCDQCDSSVLPSPSPSCSSMPSMSSQSRGSLAATTAVVECTTTKRSATESTMSALATPVEQCPARTVNRMQTLPVANGGTIKGPSSGCTSRRSACGLKAAGTTSFSRMIPCAEDTTSPSHSQLPLNEFIAWYLSEIQCFPASSRSLVDTLMRMCIPSNDGVWLQRTHRSKRVRPSQQRGSNSPCRHA